MSEEMLLEDMLLASERVRWHGARRKEVCAVFLLETGGYHDSGRRERGGTMAKDLGDTIGVALGRAAREAAQTVATNARKSSKNGSLSGAKGVAAGVGLAALAPLAAKGAGKLAKGVVAKPAKKVGKGVKETVDKTVGDAGGAAGLAKKAGKGLIPGVGDSDGAGGKKNDMPGVGKGRRMPIQQAIDVAVPIATAYNQWTQFEDWPKFMHRLDRVTQEDECNVSFKTKIWGISKEFQAEIVEQRPDERIKWQVTEGVTHTGVVTFHELSDRLTRIEVNLDVDPGSLIEKAGRGMRHVKRAVRADLARFKAYIEMEEEETGAWRGVIEDGEVKSSKGSSSSGRRRSSSSGSSKSSASGRGRGGGSSSRGRSKASSGGSKASSSGSRSRSASSRSKSSSNGSGSSGGGRRRTTAKGRSSSNARSRSSNGRSASSGGSRSSSSRKKSGSRS
jgi:uncharacterized membrane protein